MVRGVWLALCVMFLQRLHLWDVDILQRDKYPEPKLRLIFLHTFPSCSLRRECLGDQSDGGRRRIWLIFSSLERWLEDTKMTALGTQRDGSI